MVGSSFAYRAIRIDGTAEEGVIEATSREAARETLAARSLFTESIRLRRSRDNGRQALPLSDLSVGLRVLSTLLGSGLPVNRALEAMTEVVPPSWRARLPHVSHAVEQGTSLAAALRDSSLGIPPHVVGIIQAGEIGSALPMAMRRCADMTEAAAATKTGVMNALAYPIMLVISGMLSIGLLIGFVLPRFSLILADLGQELPLSTRLVLGASAIAHAAALPALIAAVLLAVGLRLLLSDERARIQLSTLVLSLPLVGSIRLSMATAEACTTLSALMESGIRVSAALVHAAQTSGNAAVKVRLIAARERVIAGASMSSALESTHALSPSAIRLARAGERSGQLSAMLEHAARLEREHAARLVRTFVRLIEPTLIILLSAVVALVAAAMLQAVYSLRPV